MRRDCTCIIHVLHVCMYMHAYIHAVCQYLGDIRASKIIYIHMCIHTYIQCANIFEISALPESLANIQLQPSAVVTYIYPPEGNEIAIGHDLLRDPGTVTQYMCVCSCNIDVYLKQTVVHEPT